MATVRFYESSLSEVSEVVKPRNGTTLKKIVNDFVNKKEIVDTVEVYFPDTDETKFVPLEEDSYDVVIVVNGVEQNLDYKVQKDDDIIVMCMQHSNGNQGMAWSGVAMAIVGIAALIVSVASYGTLAAPAAMIVAGVGSALLGAGIGMAVSGFVADSMSKQDDKKGSQENGIDKEGLLGINGGSNEPIVGKNYPLILGKHLINPYVIGSPYHETYNRSITSKSKDTKANVPVNSPRGIKDYFEEYQEDESKLDISNLKLDHHDDGQYYKALYCAGYGPLKLTDFRIGDTKLSYNRPYKSKV